MKCLHVTHLTRLLPVAAWVLAVWVSICAAPCLAGTAYQWTATTGNWNNASNWDIGIPPASNLTDLYFPNNSSATYISTNDFSGERVIESIILSGGGTTATGTNVIAGNPVDIRNSANQIANNNSSTADWDIQIAIGFFPPGNQLVLTGNGSTPAVISGNIRRAAAGNSDPNRGITKSGSTTWIITGDIESTIDGPINITAGTLDLRGTGNAYTGSTTVSGGTLVAGAANVIPYGLGKGDITVNGTGAFNLDGGNQNINGLAGSGTVEITGTASRTLTIGNGNASATFSGVIQNTGSGNLTLSKVGTGTQTLSGANTYSGTTNLDLGTTIITNENAFSTGLVNMRTIGGTDTVLELDADGMTIANDFFIRNPFDNRTIRLDRTGTNTATLSGGFTVNEQTPGSFMLDVGEDDSLSLAGNVITTGGGGAGLTKTGAGTLTLRGDNNYLGVTTVDGGTLLVNNTSGSATGAGNVLVNGGTLGGTGTIAGSVIYSAGGALSPGTSIGTLTTGHLTLSDTSNSEFELFAPWQYGVSTGSTPNDLVIVNGDLALDGDLTITPVDTLSTGIYTLFTYTGSVSGEFDNLLTAGGYSGSISIDSVNGAVNLKLVPEPATFAMLLGLGGIGLIACRRRRRRN